MKRYFYAQLAKAFSFYLLPGSKSLLLDPTAELREALTARKVAFQARRRGDADAGETPWDAIVLNGNLHMEDDIQTFLEELRGWCRPETRLLITHYSSLWKPLFQLGDFLGLRTRDARERNWVGPSDVENLLLLAGFERVSSAPKVLVPVYVPVIGSLLNRWLAPLPFFRFFAWFNLVVARPVVGSGRRHGERAEPSVSVVVAARNEAGNLEELVRRVPRMGSATEIVIVEGHSTDGTWEALQALERRLPEGGLPLVIARQSGKGKGDAIRKGFELARNDILMILDADLTVSPEELPKFYRAIRSGRGEFINGSRLVYPMEKRAMRFFNMIGNQFFAEAFSFVLGQDFKDTLCGTKVLTREQYLKIAANRSFFGDFDPFGDFDLIFGASRLALKIVELPVHYKERVYGETNISRWSHGWLLLRMVVFAARKIKFV